MTMKQYIHAEMKVFTVKTDIVTYSGDPLPQLQLNTQPGYGEF